MNTSGWGEQTQKEKEKSEQSAKGWWDSQFTFLRNSWPMVLVLSTAAITLADSHYDGRYVKASDGIENQVEIKDIKESVKEVEVEQAAQGKDIESIKDDVSELKHGQNTINEKLDRLVEKLLK